MIWFARLVDSLESLEKAAARGRGRGFKASRPLAALPLSMHPAVRAWQGELPPTTTAPTAAVMDQINTSSCTAHAASAAISPQVGFTVSQATLYGVVKRIEIAQAGQPLSTPITDDGADPADVLTAAQTWGVCPRASSDVYDARNSDAEPATVTRNPDLASVEASAQRVLVGVYAIETARDMQVALAVVSKAVTLACFVDTAFEEWHPAYGPIGAPNMGDPQGGGHALCVAGYSTAADGSIVWNIQNSWGARWGDDGHIQCSAAWAAGTTCRYVWDVKVVTP